MTVSVRADRYEILDVRQSEEFAAGHIAGARHIPIGEIGSRHTELSNDREVVVVCQIGQRSALVVEFLRAEGMQAHNLDGGLEAWVAAGLPLQTKHETEGKLVDGWARDIQGRLLRGGQAGSE